MRRKLSATMAVALALAHEHGGRLEARTWGAWTYPGAPHDYRPDGIPDWFVRRATVEALVARGEMKFVQWKGSAWARKPIAAEIVVADAVAA